LEARGIGDAAIRREIEIEIVYKMWSTGDIDLAEVGKYVFNKLLYAWLADDASIAIPIIEQMQGLASMFGVSNAYSLGYEVNRHYPGAADAEYWDDLWYHYGMSPSWAKGGIVSEPTYGLIGEAGYPEAIIPMLDGSSIPVRWINGGSTQEGASSERPIDINVTLEIDGQPLDVKIKNISSREADNVRVKAERRPLGARRI